LIASISCSLTSQFGRLRWVGNALCAKRKRIERNRWFLLRQRTFRWLIFRNATHGYGGKSGERRKGEIDASLLAHYDGQMPSDIALLPYLYLLDTLSNPDRIRQSISRQVAAVPS
jgi:hypothetical protein